MSWQESRLQQAATEAAIAADFARELPYGGGDNMVKNDYMKRFSWGVFTAGSA